MLFTVKAALTMVLSGWFVKAEEQKTTVVGIIGLSPLYAVTPMILLVVNFFALVHSMMVVGPARTSYMKMAENDGEKEVKERYGLPNLYAQGTSKNAMTFNCIQRSHQHIFETMNLAIVGALVGAITYPEATAMVTSMYAVGRMGMSLDYAAARGDADKRYSSGLGLVMWLSILANSVIALLSCLSIMLAKPLFR